MKLATEKLSAGMLIQQELSVVRALMVAPAALCVTGFLIWGMERLIHSDPVEMPVVKEWKMPSPVLVEPPPPEIRRAKPERPEPPAEEPLPPEIDLTMSDPVNEFYPGGGRSDFVPNNPDMNFNADAPIPTMLAQPEYPVRAANRGIEGYVDVVFDVTAAGFTENVRVTFSEPVKIFDRAAMNAVKRWKFQPAEKGGKPAAFKGMTHRIVFQMGQSAG